MDVPSWALVRLESSSPIWDDFIPVVILVWSAGFMTANVLEPDESEADILVMVSVAPNLGVGVGVASYSLTA